MATRHESRQKQNALERHLRDLCRQKNPSGGALPPLRELAHEFSVSLKSAHQVLRVLQSEGLVDSSRGGGTTIRQRVMSEDEVFVRFEPDYLNVTSNIRVAEPSFVGFSTRMAELGAFVVEIQDEHILNSLTQPEGIQCRGLFARTWDAQLEARRLPKMPFPTVAFGEHADQTTDDCVEWDDFDGGRIAAEHLIALGHRSLVFVGRSTQNSHWSHKRAEGFLKATSAMGVEAHVVDSSGLSQDPVDLFEFGRRASRLMAARKLPDAVVAANDEIAVGILQALHDLDVPLARWPAIVGFDDELSFGGQSITSLRLDLREVGRAAADLLWARAHGELVGPPTVRRLPMQLIPRMTSQAAWAYRLDQLLGGFPISGSPTTGPTKQDFQPIRQL